MNTKRTSLSLVAALALAAAAVGCGRESEDDEVVGPSEITSTTPPSPAASPTATPPPAGASVAFDPDVKAVLAAHCTRCHGAFASYGGAMVYVRPGDSGSPLLQATGSGGSMARYLATPAEADLLRQWVLAGAPERR